MGRPVKPDGEKSLGKELRGRTDAPRVCVLCKKSLPVCGPYVLVVGAIDNIGRVGLACGHELQEVLQAVHDLAWRAQNPRQIN